MSMTTISWAKFLVNKELKMFWRKLWKKLIGQRHLFQPSLFLRDALLTTSTIIVTTWSEVLQLFLKHWDLYAPYSLRCARQFTEECDGHHTIVVLKFLSHLIQVIYCGYIN